MLRWSDLLARLVHHLHKVVPADVALMQKLSLVEVASREAPHRLYRIKGRAIRRLLQGFKVLLDGLQRSSTRVGRGTVICKHWASYSSLDMLSEDGHKSDIFIDTRGMTPHEHRLRQAVTHSAVYGR